MSDSGAPGALVGRFRTLLVGAALLVACGQVTYVIQQYSGPPRPGAAVAILRVNGQAAARIVTLDGAPVGTSLPPDSRLHIEIAPGVHRLSVGNLQDASRRTQGLRFRAEAGRVYRAVAAPALGTAGSGQAWRGQIFEVDRDTDALLRDVTLTDRMATPVARPRPEQQQSAPPLPAPSSAPADAGTPKQFGQADASPPCPPSEGVTAPHCLVFTPSSRGTPEELALKLKAAGHEPAIEAYGVVALFTDAQVSAFFGAPPAYRLLAGSVDSRQRCVAQVGHLPLPMGYRKLVRSVEVGHQICE